MSPPRSRARTPDAVARDLAREVEPRVFREPGSGATRSEAIEPDSLRVGKNPGFYTLVYEVVAMVPAGRVTTYGDVGTILGSPRIARQVGWALSALPPDRHDVPWQRVINAHGMVSWRGELARAALQEALLRAEGVAIGERGRVDLAALRWHYPDVVVPYRGAVAPS